MGVAPGGPILIAFLIGITALGIPIVMTTFWRLVSNSPYARTANATAWLAILWFPPIAKSVFELLSYWNLIKIPPGSSFFIVWVSVSVLLTCLLAWLTFKSLKLVLENRLDAAIRPVSLPSSITGFLVGSFLASLVHIQVSFWTDILRLSDSGQYGTGVTIHYVVGLLLTALGLFFYVRAKNAFWRYGLGPALVVSSAILLFLLFSFT
jgi:hypothetical protein